MRDALRDSGFDATLALELYARWYESATGSPPQGRSRLWAARAILRLLRQGRDAPGAGGPEPTASETDGPHGKPGLRTLEGQSPVPDTGAM